MNDWKRWGRGAIAVVAIGGAVLASSGCVSLDNVFADQDDVVGDVTVFGTACQSGSAGCSGIDIANGDLAGTTGEGQLMVGYRIPANVTPPTVVEGDTAGVTFSASPTYAAELERLKPAGPGRRWAGYISTTMDVGAADKNIALRGRFGLQQGADGAPFAGPLAYRMVIGERPVGPDAPANRPVVCGPDLVQAGPDLTICVDSPLVATIDGPDLTEATRDLGILTGATGSGQAGTTVTVPFTARYAGSSTAGANFALSAATTVPGGTAVVTPGSLLPATDSSNPVSVAVAVPAGTAPGNYDVTLTATLGTQSRVRTGTLTVVAPPAAPAGPTTGGGLTPGGTAPPALRLTGALPARLAFLTARGKGVKVVVRSNRSGRAVMRLVQRGKVVVTKTVTLRNGSTTVVLRSRKVVAGAYRVTVTFTATRRVVTLRGTLRAR